MRVSLMIEGQEGVTWDQWLALGRACEESGLEGLFRSDHYRGLMGKERDSLDAWTTLAGLANATQRIRLGTLVSPSTFRHPSVLAKSVVTVDHISRGRVELGIGAGWNEAEHRAHGFPFPTTKVRMEMLAEQVEIVHRSWNEERFDFAGSHYRVEALAALPKPFHRPHPNLILGGLANPRGLAIAARWADEYNTTFPTLSECAYRRARAVHACEEAGRDPSTLVFSVMGPFCIGIDQADLRRRARAIMEHLGMSGSEDEWLASIRDRWVVGTVDEAVERLREFEALGVERMMLQHHVYEDVETVHMLGAEVAPKLA